MRDCSLPGMGQDLLSSNCPQTLLNLRREGQQYPHRQDPPTHAIWASLPSPTQGPACKGLQLGREEWWPLGPGQQRSGTGHKAQDRPVLALRSCPSCATPSRAGQGDGFEASFSPELGESSETKLRFASRPQTMRPQKHYQRKAVPCAPHPWQVWGLVTMRGLVTLGG